MAVPDYQSFMLSLLQFLGDGKELGYGESRKEAGKAIGCSGDGGADGITNEDQLGLANCP